MCVPTEEAPRKHALFKTPVCTPSRSCISRKVIVGVGHPNVTLAHTRSHSYRHRRRRRCPFRRRRRAKRRSVSLEKRAPGEKEISLAPLRSVDVHFHVLVRTLSRFSLLSLRWNRRPMDGRVIRSTSRLKAEVRPGRDALVRRSLDKNFNRAFSIRLT